LYDGRLEILLNFIAKVPRLKLVVTVVITALTLFLGDRNGIRRVKPAPIIRKRL